jgi:hypothetical protein
MAFEDEPVLLDNARDWDLDHMREWVLQDQAEEVLDLMAEIYREYLSINN